MSKNRNSPEVMHTACAYVKGMLITHIGLIVALKEDKQEHRGGCFVAGHAVNVLYTTLAGLVSCKI